MSKFILCAVLASLSFLPVTARAGPDCVAYRDLSAVPGLGDAPVAVDLHGRILIVDSAGARVLRAVSARSGILHMMAGPDLLVRPVDVAVGPDGSVFVADAGRFAILRFTPQGHADRVFGGNGGDAPGEFRDITAIDVDASGGLHVLDDGNHRVTSYDPRGVLLDSWTLPDRETVAGGERRRPADDAAVPLARSISYPRVSDLALDPEGHPVILFPDEGRVGRFDGDGRLLVAWGEPGTGPGRLRDPVGLAACGASGLIYVSDTGNACVQLFTGNGKYVGQWQAIDRRDDALVIRMRILGNENGNGGRSDSDIADHAPVAVASEVARPVRPVVDTGGRVHLMDPVCGALISFAYPECPGRARVSLLGPSGCEAVLDPVGVQDLVLVLVGSPGFAADRLRGGVIRLDDGTVPVRTWVTDAVTRTPAGGECLVRAPDGLPDLGMLVPGTALLADAGVDAFGETGTYTLLGSLEDGTPFWATGAVRGGIPQESEPARRRPDDDVAGLAYVLDATVPVTVRVYDVAGRLVETVLQEVQAPGAHEAVWDGAHRPNGIYFLRVRAGELDRVRKIVIRN